MKVHSINILREARSNVTLRRVLFTGPRMQLAALSVKPGEESGPEAYPEIDQLVRVEQGAAEVEIEDGTFEIDEGSVIVIPAGARHRLRNPSADRDLKLSLVLSPPLQAEGVVPSAEAVVDVRAVETGRLAARQEVLRPGG